MTVTRYKFLLILAKMKKDITTYLVLNLPVNVSSKTTS